MQAQSKAQQRAAGAALAAKRDPSKIDELEGASKDMFDTMTEGELEEMASTSHDDLPENADQKN